MPETATVLPNLAELGAFFADPHAQYLLERKLAVAGHEVIASFHSHPEGAALLSDADLESVFELAPFAIVIGLEGRRRIARVGAFTCSGSNQVTEITVVREDL